MTCKVRRKIEFRSQKFNPLRATEAYWLPFVPEVDQDLNSCFTDEDFEKILNMPSEPGKPEISFAEANILFHDNWKKGSGLGFIGTIRKLGYTIRVRPEEYRFSRVASEFN